jgi:hypothetical protein
MLDDVERSLADALLEEIMTAVGPLVEHPGRP